MLNFLSFSHDYWDGPRHNRHYFCEALSREARVLFASPPVDPQKVVESLVGRRTLSPAGFSELNPNLITYVPSRFLFVNHRIPAVNRWMRERRLARIRREARRRGMMHPLLLLWHPMFADMVGEFDEPLVIYYVYDEYTGYTGGSGQSGQNPAEQDLLRRADLVFTLSRGLYEAKRPYARRIHHLANAADFELFSTARAAATQVPHDLERIATPRIGYVGTMNEKLDVGTLEHIASARPGWSLVLVGRENYTNAEAKRRFLELAARRNVHWLGARPYNFVPRYIKGLDVCMMCYVVNDWTFYGDPSKLHEYLASGKPTVGVGLRAIREFRDVVTIAHAPEEWIHAIESGLRESGTALRERRIQTARDNSYSARIAEFLRIVQETMGDRRLKLGA